MENRCSNSFAASLQALLAALLSGMAQLALCKHGLVGVVIIACIAPFSLTTCGVVLLGALAATLWPFWRQQDMRLLSSGWYGVNGALWGFLVDWHLVNPLGAILVTLLGAWIMALILDQIVLPLGDAPLNLQPLTLPFILLAIPLTLWSPPLLPVIEHLDQQLTDPAPPAASPLWQALPPEARGMQPAAQAWRDYAAGAYPQAHDTFLTLTQAFPGQADYWNGLGWAALRVGNREAAKAAFQHAVAIQANHPYALDGLAWMALHHGRFQEAAHLFQVACAQLPTWAEPCIGQGWALYQKGAYRQAQQSFQQALARDPHSADSLSGLGWVAMRTHQREEASRLFSQALHEDNRAQSAREGLAWSQVALHRGSAGEDLFRDLLARAAATHTTIQGIADSHRLMLLHGEKIRVDPHEWQMVADHLGHKIWLIPLLLLSVFLSTPVAAWIALLLMLLGMTFTVSVAGASSLLWIDLHLQTVAMTALLVGRAPQLQGIAKLCSAFLAVLAACLCWTLLHLAEFWIPLLPFNLVGILFLLGLARLERHRERLFAQTLAFLRR
jgi:Tfp pilus assembly protein PilF/urea transporter